MSDIDGFTCICVFAKAYPDGYVECLEDGQRQECYLPYTVLVPNDIPAIKRESLRNHLERGVSCNRFMPTKSAFDRLGLGRESDAE